MKVLKVLSNTTLESLKTGQSYVRSTFAEVEFMGEHCLIGENRTASRVYNPGKEFPVGTLMKGAIITLPTEDYDIDGRTVNSTTVCVIGSENAIELANDSLQRNGDDVWVINNGKSTKPVAADKPAKANKSPKVGA